MRRFPSFSFSRRDADVKAGWAVDLWSVGCILAELLGGRPIFKGKDYVDQLNQILHYLGTPDEQTLRAVGSPRVSRITSYFSLCKRLIRGMSCVTGARLHPLAAVQPGHPVHPTLPRRASARARPPLPPALLRPGPPHHLRRSARTPLPRRLARPGRRTGVPDQVRLRFRGGRGQRGDEEDDCGGGQEF